MKTTNTPPLTVNCLFLIFFLNSQKRIINNNFVNEQEEEKKIWRFPLWRSRFTNKAQPFYRCSLVKFVVCKLIINLNWAENTLKKVTIFRFNSFCCCCCTKSEELKSLTIVDFSSMAILQSTTNKIVFLSRQIKEIVNCENDGFNWNDTCCFTIYHQSHTMTIVYHKSQTKHIFNGQWLKKKMEENIFQFTCVSIENWMDRGENEEKTICQNDFTSFRND